ncbi:MAG: single-stranded DNA-binding protein [Holosporales bacterium]|nr:single-stranded DNA-binding protein [Holosporales bacterium]
MAGSVNKVLLIGNLGKDPEFRVTQDGGKFATFSVATSESIKDKNTGERVDRTEWHRITVFNEHFVEVVEKYVKKGSKVYIEGQLQTRKWTDQQGIERYTTDVIIPRFRGELALLDKINSSEGGSGSTGGGFGGGSGGFGGGSNGGGAGGSSYDDMMQSQSSPLDEVPF